MTVATLKDVLGPAIAGRYAVAGLVVLGWEDAKAYVAAAEELGLPVILQAGPGCRQHTPIPILGKMFRYLAEQANVPVVCHIDHARTVDECRAGIEHGFSSVMIDGSMLPLDENISLTNRVIEIAKSASVSVEGEVGFVGYNNGAISAPTSAEDAARFARETGIDALAISIGNVHLQTEKAAAIDFTALSAIEAVTTVPLVLHGGSGIPSTLRRKLAQDHRIKKFNIGTELRMAFGQALRASLESQPQEFDRNTLLTPTIKASQAAAMAVMAELAGRVFASGATGPHPALRATFSRKREK
jgi:fructose-bisphosphate aldolase, class II